MAVIVPRFLDPLVLLEVTDRTWALVQEFRYDSAVVGARLVVPAGFETDLASVPRIPLAYWLAGDTGRKAGLLHDFAYTTHITGPDGRSLADALFQEALAVEGVPRWRRAAMYAAVRAFGASHW